MANPRVYYTIAHHPGEAGQQGRYHVRSNERKAEAAARAKCYPDMGGRVFRVTETATTLEVIEVGDV